jgi:hypothetical protein
MSEPKINCRICKHFYITWNQNFPYGCRAIGFKAKKLPSMEVKKTSGIDCQRFSKKASNKKL